MTGYRTPLRAATRTAAVLALGLGLGTSGQAQVAPEQPAFALAFADLPRAVNDTAARSDAVDVTEVLAPAHAEAAPADRQAVASNRLGSGVASYYADRFHGLRTASGEAFDNRALTAAHRTLPFGSLVRVTNPTTGASVVVRINDRGPFTRGRTIDVSRAAAEQLGLVRAGHAEVELELLEG